MLDILFLYAPKMERKFKNKHIFICKSFKYNIPEIPDNKIMSHHFLENTDWIIRSHGTWQL